MQLASAIPLAEGPVRGSTIPLQDSIAFGLQPPVEICFRKDSCPILQEVLSENEKIREIFEFGRIEFEKRNQRISFLELQLSQTEEILGKVQKENIELKKELEEEKAKVLLFTKALFGTGNEKEEVVIIETKSKVEKKKRGAKEKHEGHGRKIPDLPVIEKKTIDLDDDKKRCPCCGKERKQEERLNQISYEVIVKKIYGLREIIRLAYIDTCNCNNTLALAPVQPKLIPKGLYGIEFWIQVLLEKYLKNVPINKQLLELKLNGIDAKAGTIFGGLLYIWLNYIKQLYETFKEEIKSASHTYSDETSWYIFTEIEGKENYHWYMWVFVSYDVVVFVLDSTRSSKVPYDVLFGIDVDKVKDINSKLSSLPPVKILNADRYSAYKTLQNKGLIKIAYCWAHVRRDFVETKIKYPLDQELTEWAESWIKKIKELYKANNERILCEKDSNYFKEYTDKIKSMLDSMYDEIQKEYQKQVQIEIMNSMKEHWKGLIIFADNPDIPMDNNLSERMLRPIVLGRKNYWGNHSIWGGNLVAAMNTIIQSCIKNDISPKAYLEYYFTECAKKGKTPEKIESFLPHKLPEDIKKNLRITQPDAEGIVDELDDS